MQEQAGCIIGRDYPKPIVEHEALSKRNIMRMKAAYAQRSHSKAAQVEKESTKKGNHAPTELFWSLGYLRLMHGMQGDGKQGQLCLGGAV